MQKKSPMTNIPKVQEALPYGADFTWHHRYMGKARLDQVERWGAIQITQPTNRSALSSYQDHAKMLADLANAGSFIGSWSDLVR